MYYARVISYLPYTISWNNSMFGLGKEGVTGKKRREDEKSIAWLE